MAQERDPDLALFLAAAGGDREGVAAAIEAGADVRRAEPASRMAPLDWAARMGRRGCVEELLGAGADPWAATGMGGSPIDIAMEHGQWGVLELLAEGGGPASSKTPRKVRAAFKAAAMAPNLPAMKLFMRLGADVDAPCPGSSMPALALAAQRRLPDSVAALLEAGASPDAAHEEGGQRWCPARVAIYSGWAQGLKMLLDAGAGGHARQGLAGLGMEIAQRRDQLAEDPDLLSILEAAGAGLCGQEHGGRMLYEAVWSGNVGAARWLCERGVDPASSVSGSQTPLELVRRDASEPMTSMIELYALAARERREISAAAEGPGGSSPRRRV